MEEHEKALMLLVHQLQEYPGAEQYCMDNSEVSVHVVPGLVLGREHWLCLTDH